MSIKNEWREKNHAIYKATCIDEDGNEFCGHKYGTDNRLVCMVSKNLNKDTGLCKKHHAIYEGQKEILINRSMSNKFSFKHGLYGGLLREEELEAYKQSKIGTLEEELRLLRAKTYGLLSYIEKLEKGFNGIENPTDEEIESFNIKYINHSKQLMGLAEQIRKLEISHKELTNTENDPLDKLKDIAKGIGIIRTKNEDSEEE